MADREDAWWIYYDPTSGGNGPPVGGKRRLIREGGPASRFRDHVRPRDPGGGAGSTVSPQPMTIDDVFQTVEQSGGGPQLVPSRVSPEWTLQETMAGDISGRECPHDDIGIRPRMGTIWMSEDRVPTTNIESPYGGGVSPLPGATGSLLPVKFPPAPVLLADGPQLGSWQVAVMRVDETPAGDASGRKCPCAEQNRQRPIDVSEVTGNVRPVVPAGGFPLAGVVNPAGPDGPVVAGGPVGPCEMPSPSSEETQEPLEHAVLIQADPVGQPAAVGTLSPSDCYPVGPAGPYVAGGPVGPDAWFSDPEPLEHAVLIHADPAGQHAAAVGMLSPSDCYPAGPAGPYVAGGPVVPDDCLQVLEPFEQLVLDHAEPAGQHAVILDTAESLEHAVVENILDGPPMEGITCPELLEHSLRLLDATLDGGLVENISEWEPEPSPVPDATLDGRLREGNTYLEHSAPGVSLDSGLMEGMSSLEPLRQSVLNTLLVTRPEAGITKETTDWEPVAHPVPSTTLDGRLKEGNTYLEHSSLGVSLDSGLMEGISRLELIEQSVLNMRSVA